MTCEEFKKLLDEHTDKIIKVVLESKKNKVQ